MSNRGGGSEGRAAARSSAGCPSLASSFAPPLNQFTVYFPPPPHPPRRRGVLGRMSVACLIIHFTPAPPRPARPPPDRGWVGKRRPALVKAGQSWSKPVKVVKAGQSWSKLVKAGRSRSKLVKAVLNFVCSGRMGGGQGGAEAPTI